VVRGEEPRGQSDVALLVTGFALTLACPLCWIMGPPGILLFTIAMVATSWGFSCANDEWRRYGRWGMLSYLVWMSLLGTVTIAALRFLA
jgi:hypothetical protein